MGSYDELKKSYKEVKERILEVENKAWSEKDKFLKEVQSLKIDKKILEEREKMKKSFENEFKNDPTSGVHKKMDDDFQGKEFLNKNDDDQEKLNLIMQIKNLKQENRELKAELAKNSNFEHELKNSILEIFDDTTDKYRVSWQEIKAEWNLEIGKLHTAEIEIDRYSKSRYGVGLFEEEKDADEVITASKKISSVENKEEVVGKVLSDTATAASLSKTEVDYQQLKEMILNIIHNGKTTEDMFVGAEELQELKSYMIAKNGHSAILELLENPDISANDEVVSYEFAEKEIKKIALEVLEKSEIDEGGVLEFDLKSERGIIGQLEGIKDSIKK